VWHFSGTYVYNQTCHIIARCQASSSELGGSCNLQAMFGLVGTCYHVQGDPTGVRVDVNRVLARDGKSSVNLASQGHCAGVFIGI
jgi:hypothetical protein